MVVNLFFCLFLYFSYNSLNTSISINIFFSEQERDFEIFQEWIEEIYNQPSTQNWTKIILFYAEDEADALEIFFSLFPEFIQPKQPCVHSD